MNRPVTKMMRRAVILSLLTLLSPSVRSAAAQKTSPISGVYELVEVSRRDKIVATMELMTNGTGDLLVQGIGSEWTGKGKASANTGYYDWKFSDGKMGRTTFVINADGTLTGHVFGSGLDWRFLARRQPQTSKPQS